MHARMVAAGLAVAASMALGCRGGASDRGHHAAAGTARGDNVTLVGCLEAGAGSTLLLRTTDDAGPTTSFTGHNLYRLVPAGGVDLTGDVGHEIQVTGNAEQQNGRDNGRAVATSGSRGASGGKNSAQNSGVSGSNPGGSGVQGGMLGNLLPFRVNGIRKVADSCAGPEGD